MKFDYQKYLEEKHSKHRTPDDTINEIVEKITNSKVINKSRIVKGEDNEVYDVKASDDESYILRISRYRSFDYEVWAMEKSRNEGVPIPNILGIGEKELELEKIYYCLLSKVPGKPLSESIKEYEDDHFKDTFISAGEILAKIHKIKTTGYWDIDPQGHGKMLNFESYANEILGKAEIFKEVAIKNNFNPEIIPELFQLLEADKNKLNDLDTYLAHGDYSPKHIMVTEDKITGILDFGVCKSALIYHDFADWDFWHKRNKNQIKYLKEGYETISPLENFDFNFHVIKGFLTVELLWWSDQNGHISGINHAKESILDDIEYLKQ